MTILKMLATTAQEAGQGQTIFDLIAPHAAATPDHTAMVSPGGRQLSYGDLADRLLGLIGALQSLGATRDTRVALVLPTGPAMGMMFLATSSTATCAPLNPGYTADEFQFYLRDLGAGMVVLAKGSDSPARAVAKEFGLSIVELTAGQDGLDPQLLGATAAPQPALSTLARAEDTALVLHTSGTTSRPKIVPLTHRNIVTSVGDVSASIALGPQDRCLHAMPMFHIGGLVDLTLTPLAAGSTILYTGAFEAGTFFRNIATLSPTWFQGVPTMLQELVDYAGTHGIDPITAQGGHNLRLIRAVAAALPTPVKAKVHALFGTTVVETYGMTEAAPLITSTALDPAAQKSGAVGVSVGPDICILVPHGAPLPTGQLGEVAIKGDNVITAYENNEEANASSFRDGYFLTGDLGWLDADGHLFLAGRSKEIINRGGQKISPAEVDEALMGLESVHQVASFALPHATLGEEVAALVVPQSGATLTTADITDFASQHLAGYKVPRVIRIVDTIPKGPTGKLQRHKLAEVLATLPATAETLTEAGRALLPKVLETARKLLGDDALGAQDNFFARGGNSLLAVRYCLELSEILLVDVPTTLLFRTQSLGEVAEAIASGDHAEGSALRVLRTGAPGVAPLFTINATREYELLGAHLDPDQPIYNLNIFGLTDRLGDSVDEVDLHQIAALFADDIRDAGLDDPQLTCQFLAFCQDGPLALEVARNLQAGGVPAPRLYLIDSFFQPLNRSKRMLLDSVLRIGWPFIRIKLRGALKPPHIEERFEGMTPERRTALMEKSRLDSALYARYVQHFKHYRPQSYEGQVVALISQEWRLADLSELHVLSGARLETRFIKGMHNYLFLPDHIQNLACDIASLLTNARTNIKP